MSMNPFELRGRKDKRLNTWQQRGMFCQAASETNGFKVELSLKQHDQYGGRLYPDHTVSPPRYRESLPASL